MSHFVAYILQFQEIIVYKIPPGGGGGSIASLRSIPYPGLIIITIITYGTLTDICFTCFKIQYRISTCLSKPENLRLIP